MAPSFLAHLFPSSQTKATTIDEDWPFDTSTTPPSTLSRYLSLAWRHLTNPIPWTIAFLIMAPLTLTSTPSNYYMIMALWWNAHLMAVSRAVLCMAEDVGRWWENEWTRRYVTLAWVVAGLGISGHVLDVGLLYATTAEVKGWHRGMSVAMLVVSGIYLGMHVFARCKKRRGGNTKPYVFLYDDWWQ